MTTTDLHAHAVEVDTRIAAAFTGWVKARQQTAWQRDSVRSGAGQRQDYSRRSWNGTLDEAIDTLTDMGDDLAVHTSYRASEILAKLATLTEAQLAAEAAYVAAQDEYEGWSRFFLVVGGHIHSTMGCHTCYPTTEFGWLPALSGLTEADAVAVYGGVLCSICYPSAPVESTGGYSDGLTLAEQEARRSEKAAKADAKAAKLVPADDQFRGFEGTVTTVAAAKVALRDAAKATAGWGYLSRQENAPSVRAAARAALSNKGMTDDELDTIEARAVKAGAKEGWSH